MSPPEPPSSPPGDDATHRSDPGLHATGPIDPATMLGLPGGLGERVGKYVLQEQLGRGAMGTVYAAFDPDLQRRVALKVLHGLGDDSVARFVREAQAQARIQHPHLCQVFEVGFDGRCHFIAMQCVRGPTLAALGPTLSVSEKVRLVRDAAEALHAAHELGLVHRDVKPGNILVEQAPDGRWSAFVTDFGLVRDLSVTADSLSGEVLGTPGFLSPEQARGAATDRRTDVYALGASLYSLIAGHTPFAGPDLGSLLQATLHQPPPPLRREHPEVTRDLESVIQRCLEKRPAQRYPSAQSLAVELTRVLAGEPVEARPIPLGVRIARAIARNPAVSAASAIALTGLGIGLGAAVRGQLHARQEARAEREIGAGIAQLEGALCIDFLLPAHDVEPELAQLTLDMNALAARARELGVAGDGLDHYVLGRGHLLLGELAAARPELEAAWDAGLRTPEEEEALGEVLGRLYGADRAGPANAGKATRPALGSQEAAGLLFAAHQHLGAAAASHRTGAAAEWIRGLLAFWDEQYPDALDHARAARRDAPPGFYEPALLEGRALRFQATGARLAGHRAEASALRQQAAEVLAQVADMARSDPEVLTSVCWVSIERFWDALQHADAADAAFTIADDRCAQPLRVKPHDAAAALDQAQLRADRAEDLARRGHDAAAAVAAARSSLARAERSGAEPSRLAWLSSEVERVAGLEARRVGDDPRPALTAAIGFAATAVRTSRFPAPMLEEQYLAVRTLGEALDARGEDNGPQLQQAAEITEHLIAADPERTESYLFGALAQLSLATHALQVGADAGASLSAARRDLERLTHDNPHSAMGYRNLARLERLDDRAERLAGRGRPTWSAAALHWLDLAAESRPGAVDILAVRVDALLQLAQDLRSDGADPTSALDAAEAVAAEAHRLDPKDADTSAALASVDFERALGTAAPSAAIPMLRRAEANLRAALVLQPGDGDLLAQLARTESERAERLRALERPDAGLLATARADAARSLQLNARNAMALAAQARAALTEAAAATRNEDRARLRELAAHEMSEALHADATIRVDEAGLLLEAHAKAAAP